jgi:hypothetical protein
MDLTAKWPSQVEPGIAELPSWARRGGHLLISIARGLNFTLITDLGALDLLGEVTGGGRYEDLARIIHDGSSHPPSAFRRALGTR